MAKKNHEGLLRDYEPPSPDENPRGLDQHGWEAISNYFKLSSVSMASMVWGMVFGTAKLQWPVGASGHTGLMVFILHGHSWSPWLWMLQIGGEIQPSYLGIIS